MITFDALQDSNSNDLYSCILSDSVRGQSGRGNVLFMVRTL